MAKPALFVGSSSEGMEFARASREALEDVAEVTLWNEDFFEPGKTFIERLVEAVAQFDFALLILTADDLVHSRAVEAFGPRDNVLFELGLFMGRLGRSRTFVLHQRREDLKMPSDLAGMTTLSFEWPRGDNSHRAAVGASTDKMSRVVRSLGFSESRNALAITALSARQERQEVTLARQQSEIRSLQVALQGIVTDYEYDKLAGLASDRSFLCYYSDDLYNEVKRLRAMGLAKNYEGVGLSSIRREYKDRGVQFDLKQFFFLTDRGREYLNLRKDLVETSD
jgi:predicted nucleotide-binding protein with TIR-like domain